MANEVYVRASATPGDLGGGDGSAGHPFHSVKKAIDKLKDSTGTVRLFGGTHYVESVVLDGVRGLSTTNRITVEPVVGSGEVFIDSCLPQFLRPKGRWVAVPPPVGVVGEYRWSETTTAAQGVVRHGAFDKLPRHTRLVSYDRIEDLRSTGQIWPRNSGQNRVFIADPNDATKFIATDTLPPGAGKPTRRPWVYMGPGIWFGHATGDPAGNHLHIRMSRTTNNVSDEWPDYTGETDPNQLALALSKENDHALFLKDCDHITLKELTLRFGSPETVLLNNCTDIVFDHCRIRSGSRAISLNVDNAKPLDENRDIEIGNCKIDGGIPTWFFRSDRKDEYRFGPKDKNTVTKAETQVDKLGYSTSGVQISGKSRCFDVEIHHCEIFNAHDSYVFGDGMRFHHNWVHNLNDDGIAISVDADTKNCHIFCNAMTKGLTALSFAAKRAAGVVYIYANLFDIRQPTLGVRPPAAGAVADSLRQGHFFKDGADEGEIHLFHNTCLVLDPGAKGDDFGDANDAGFSYYATIGQGLKPRTAFNNIFTAAFTPGQVSPVAFLAPDTFACETNGNTFFRIPPNPSDNFLVRRRNGPAGTNGTWFFADLTAYHHKYWPDGEEEEYEHKSLLADPGFHAFDTTTGDPHGNDDLRLQPRPDLPQSDRTAWRAAVPMPDPLGDFYFDATGTHSADRGCYPGHGPHLKVGVNGEKEFPQGRPGPVLDTHPMGDPQVVDPRE